MPPTDDESLSTDSPVPGWCDALVTPKNGVSGLHTALERDVRRRLKQLFTLNCASHPIAAVSGFRLAQAQLKQLARQRLADAATIVREPPIATLIATLSDSRKLTPAATTQIFRSLVLGLLFELSNRGLLEEPVTLSGRFWAGGEIHSVHAGIRMTLPNDVSSLVFENGGIDLNGGAQVVAKPYHHLWRGAYLALEDNNPTSVFVDHPDQPDGRRLGLGDRSLKDWIVALTDAFEVIERHLPQIATELAVAARLVLPVGCHDETHFSASYDHMPGCAYVSLHPDTLTMAEALIHEFQHNKILAATRTEKLWLNSAHERFASPLRPDPRPMRGIVLAAHAFVPVALLHQSLANSGDTLAHASRFARRRDEILTKNADALKTIHTAAKLTAAGAKVVAQMTTLDARSRAVNK